MLLSPFTSTAQISSYGSYDNLESAVFQVENMKPNEIKMYNSWADKGVSEQARLMTINAVRAQVNLLAAPATIVDIHHTVLKDTMKALNGLNEISISLINSTPKTIKEITFKFSFKGENHETVYDIKTGDKYCILKYTNLVGRTMSADYANLMAGIMQSFHYLNYKDAAYCKPFYNKTARTVNLERINILYTDNTTSNKISIFDKGFVGDNNLYANGPLQPVTTLLDRLGRHDGKQSDDTDDKIFDVVDEMPSFKGGPSALMKYIAESLKYPIVAKENEVQGRVIVSFVVEKDGSISNVAVVRSVDSSLDHEAMRVIKSMPKWNPGRQNGRAVRSKYNIPVSFRL